MAPDVEIFGKIEIMRMISFLKADLRLSAHRTPELRIAALGDWGMTLTQKSRMRIAPASRIASTGACLRCTFEDYFQTNLRKIKLGWRKSKPSQKQGIRRNIYVMLRLTWAFRSQGIFECLPNIFPQTITPYSIPRPPPFGCTMLLSKLCGSPALFSDT